MKKKVLLSGAVFMLAAILISWTTQKHEKA